MNLGVARDNGPRLYCDTDKASTTPSVTAWATLGSSFLGRADKQTPQLKVEFNSTLRPRKSLGCTRVLKTEIFLSVQKKKKNRWIHKN